MKQNKKRYRQLYLFNDETLLFMETKKEPVRVYMVVYTNENNSQFTQKKEFEDYGDAKKSVECEMKEPTTRHKIKLARILLRFLYNGTEITKCIETINFKK
jgi:hypothetical protein